MLLDSGRYGEQGCLTTFRHHSHVAYMSFLAGAFCSPDRLPKPFMSLVLVYPLTRASLLVRARQPVHGSVLVLATYTVMFFYLAGKLARKMG